MIAAREFQRLVIAAVCLLIAIAAGVVSARAEDNYPSRPITMIVPFAAGGPTDILARLVSQTISPMLGQQVVVEDVTGAGGTIGATRAARADPDGYPQYEPMPSTWRTWSSLAAWPSSWWERLQFGPRINRTITQRCQHKRHCRDRIGRKSASGYATQKKRRYVGNTRPENRF
jgi:hypothetical protein